jgi:hypothetical protein
LTTLKGKSTIDLKSKKVFKRISKNFYRGKMEKFKYGPLIWNCINEDDESGNYFWNGRPPVGYDTLNIPIDERGMQCLPIESPVHPTWQPDQKEFVYNEYMRQPIPSIEQAKRWFDDNFLVVPVKQCKKYIIKWLSNNLGIRNEFYLGLRNNSNSLEDVMDKLWPQDEHK